MLEFLALFYLVKKNRENALARGRKPGGFIALTFILWFHFELVLLLRQSVGLSHGFAPSSSLKGIMLHLFQKAP